MVFSDLFQDSINYIFNRDIFTTPNTLMKKLTQKEKQLKELQAKSMLREQNLTQLIKEIKAKDYYNLTKEHLLTSSAVAADSNKIVMKPAENEMYLKDAASDDPAIKELKQRFNNKVKMMLGVSKGILREKVTKLNLELVKMNNMLKGKNLELSDKLQEVQEYKGMLEKYQKNLDDLAVVKSDLEKKVGDLQTKLETKIEDGRLKVNFQGDILFPSGSHKLRKEGVELLDSVFPILNQNITKFDIFIAGHTDNVPIKPEARDKYKSNWDLSTYRAIEVVKYLAAKGMSPRTLTAAGYGEYKPIADNSTPEGKAKNRRVELFLIPKIIKRSPGTQ